MKTKYVLNKIKWDTAGQNVKLPKSMTVLAESEVEAINAATDKTGWCIKGAKVSAWKPRPISQDEAIKIKATKLATFLHRNNKNLTSLQKKMADELWDCMVKWDRVRQNLRAYNLDGVRQKEG